ncbi:MerR family DNA-binding transcriptional regulator, partial [Streptomyces sp. NPDC088745]|uniref:MerR family DNA-binding transcriptional regulator n=1 Tax=Streptomyces sp. NPDC088745 TaxID=3365884 RepID=UPI0038013814
MRIGELAERAGVSTRTLRYYEAGGGGAPPPAGQRLPRLRGAHQAGGVAITNLQVGGLGL